jgi:integrase
VHVGPATRESYTFAVGAQIVPRAIGSVRIQDLQGADVSAWHTEMVNSGLARGTVRKCHRILHKALQCAVEDKLMTTNALATKKAPRAEQEEVQILQPNEIPVLLDGFKGHPLHTFVVLALGSGARRSELLALTWAHVNLDAATATIKIERNLEDTRELGIRVKSPKSAAGRRTIGIPPQAVDALRLHRKEQLELWLRIGRGRLPDDALVFGKWNGEPRSPTSVSREFSRQRKRIGLRYLKLHALRHTHVSILIKKGVPITEIAKRLGHSSPVITLKIYSHLFGDQDSASVAAISATLAGAFN